VLEALDADLKDGLVKNKQTEEKRHKWKSKPPQTLIALQRLKEAVVFFRATLGRAELIPYIRDPENGEVLQLDHTDWSPVGGRLLLLEPPYAFEDDFLDDAPFTGNPKTFIRGAYRPVFLIRKDFERWLKKTFGRKHSGGRHPGVGSYKQKDLPYLQQMHELLKIDEPNRPTSVHNAAWIVLKDVPKRNAKDESIVRRLTERYKEVFGSEQN
jgi:hypothetical protein